MYNFINTKNRTYRAKTCNMKIAIPTEDGLTISTDFSAVKSFLVFTIQFGEVVSEEMFRRENGSSPVCLFEEKGTLADCEKVIVSDITEEQENSFKKLNKEVIWTKEKIILNVVMNWLQVLLCRDANSCCQP
jgi:predicted Fe-Mo cluster-binding NifX family protein